MLPMSDPLHPEASSSFESVVPAVCCFLLHLLPQEVLQKQSHRPSATLTKVEAHRQEMMMIMEEAHRQEKTLTTVEARRRRRQEMMTTKEEGLQHHYSPTCCSNRQTDLPVRIEAEA